MKSGLLHLQKARFNHVEAPSLFSYRAMKLYTMKAQVLPVTYSEPSLGFKTAFCENSLWLKVYRHYPKLIAVLISLYQSQPILNLSFKTDLLGSYYTNQHEKKGQKPY